MKLYSRGLFVVAMGALSAALSAQAKAGLTITPTFAANITSDPNAATIEAGINAAIGRLQNVISNPVTVNITFQEGAGLGGSSTFFNTISYTSYRNALATHQTLSTNDTSALATLPIQAANPVNGTANVNVATSLMRALGFNSSVATDSTITLNTSIMNISRTGPQNSGFYDLQAVAAHEMDEALSMGGLASNLPTTNGAVGVMDLYRYSAAGTRSFTGSSTATSYFSIDGGITNIVNFNQNSSGDYADWKTGASPQVQDAFGTAGAIVNIGNSEITGLDVIGWNVVPEPGTLATGAFLFAGAMLRRRH